MRAFPIGSLDKEESQNLYKLYTLATLFSKIKYIIKYILSNIVCENDFFYSIQIP